MAKEMLPGLKNEKVRTFAQNSVQKQTKEIEKLSKLQSSLGQSTATGTGSTSED